MSDQKTPEEIADDDLDTVQGGGKGDLRPKRVLRGKGAPAGVKGIVLSSAGREPYIGETEKGIAMHEEQETV